MGSVVDVARRLDPETNTPEAVAAARGELSDLSRRELIDALQAVVIAARQEREASP